MVDDRPVANTTTMGMELLSQKSWWFTCRQHRQSSVHFMTRTTTSPTLYFRGKPFEKNCLKIREKAT